MRSTTFRLAIPFRLIPLAGSAQQVAFARDVQLIFERSCSCCHGAPQCLTDVHGKAVEKLLT